MIKAFNRLFYFNYSQPLDNFAVNQMLFFKFHFIFNKLRIAHNFMLNKRREQLKFIFSFLSKC